MKNLEDIYNYQSRWRDEFTVMIFLLPLLIFFPPFGWINCNSQQVFALTGPPVFYFTLTVTWKTIPGFHFVPSSLSLSLTPSLPPSICLVVWTSPLSFIPFFRSVFFVCFPATLAGRPQTDSLARFIFWSKLFDLVNFATLETFPITEINSLGLTVNENL